MHSPPSDGADPTRAADKASAGADPARNGEPWGELGLVLQKDAAWHDQHGGPADPQAGNIPGGQRDVLRSASFDNGNAQGFVPTIGSWSLANGRYQVAPATSGRTDAVSVFNEADTVIPSYFEMQATINAVKPTGGVKANAYLIFDYYSTTDFKYAGINVSNNSLEIGHRTASGWVLDKWTNLQLKSGNDYVVMLTVNGSTATIKVGTTSVSFTYPVRVDTLGVTHTLNYGLVGIGANNASAQIDNVVVQAPPGATTLDKTADFSSSKPASVLFGTPTDGTWATTTDGRFLATASAVATPAIDLIGYQVTAGSTLTILTTLKTFGQGGVVFDYQGSTYFKYAVLSADGKQIVIGHVLGNANVVDATYNTSISSGTDYKLGVTLKGGLVNVSLNGAVVVSKLYNETITQGGYGLISFKGKTVGANVFRHRGGEDRRCGLRADWDLAGSREFCPRGPRGHTHRQRIGVDRGRGQGALDRGARRGRYASGGVGERQRPNRQPAAGHPRRDDRRHNHHRQQRGRVGMVRRPDPRGQQRVPDPAVERGVRGEPG